MNSILTAIKKRLGIDGEYDHFDDDLIMDINSVLSILCQLGVGPSSGFSIEGACEEWSDFVPDLSKLETVKTYIYLKVKLMFDPPQSSNMIEAINNQIRELEWRINSQAESSNS